jgi:hypothetical protein
VEDSGVESAFIEGVRNPWGQTSYPQTFKPSYHIFPILSNLLSYSKVWALYMQNHGLSSPSLHEYAHKIHMKFVRICSENKENLYKNI